MKNHKVRNSILFAIIFVAFWLQVRQDIAATSETKTLVQPTIELKAEKPTETLLSEKYDESRLHEHFGLTSKKRSPDVVISTNQLVNNQVNVDTANKSGKTDKFNPMAWNYMLVTAYNAGDESQCDDTPCEASDLSNICDRLENGEKLVAANFVKLGSKIEIKNKDGIILGRYTVIDHTSSDYKYRVDIAFKLQEKKEALEIGKQTLLVRVIYEPKADIFYKKEYAKK